MMSMSGQDPHTAAQEDDAFETEPIAIVGMSARVPGAGDVEEFWRNLAGGVEAVRFYSREEQAALGVPRHQLDDPSFVPAAMTLDDYRKFDAAFFGMPAREAELRDPQHRLFLELTHTALEHAGYDPARFRGEIGVYAGIGPDVYQWQHLRRNLRVYSAAGLIPIVVANHPDYMATFASYKLDLRGPSVALHTACSTSLVAIHTAGEALRGGECDMAVAGGVYVDLPAEWGYVYYDDGINSPDGHCRAFDARAAGTIWGSGGGIVMLKRLSDAVADGDHIHAVMLGNAVNNDGAGKVGFSAPSQDGQAAVITLALAVAGVDPRTVGYVEAHGTGTALGDPIEVSALASAFGRDQADRGWCALGSVKTNIGHLGPAAGVAGLIKTVLALENGLIPPSLNYASPNPRIDFGNSPFYVNAKPSVWKANGMPRRAGVSSFGIGGTNAHVVLEEAPVIERERPAPRPVHLLQVSARSDTALSASLQRLSGHLAARAEEVELGDAAFTLRLGRRELEHRAAVLATSTADAAAALADPARVIRGITDTRTPAVGFLFSGQGAQYAGMGAELYRTEPVFRDAVDECAELLTDELGEDIRTLLLVEDDRAEAEAGAKLQQTAYTQPALFTVEYALAQLWRSWGIEPAGMIGHSIGEYVAATLAGVFNLADALRVVAARGRLMQDMPAGAMLAVRLDEKDVVSRLPDGMSVAAVNGPGACVVAGPVSVVEDFASALAIEDNGATLLRTSHAFHSPMMEPVLAPFAEILSAVRLSPPRLPFLSNVTGDWITADDATDPAYWTRHVRQPVRFGDCLSRLVAEGSWMVVECGPGHQLTGLARPLAARGTTVPSLPGAGDQQSGLEALYAAAGRLWVAGAPLDGERFGPRGHRVPLPTYPWERQEFWVEADPGVGDINQAIDQAQSGPVPLDEWFVVPTWRQQPPSVRTQPFTRSLVFADAESGEMVAALRSRDVEVIEVRPGDGYQRVDEQSYLVRPGEPADFDALVDDLTAGEGVPERLIHAWTLDGPRARRVDEVWAAQDRGFHSLLRLVQSLARVAPESTAEGWLHLDIVTAGTQRLTGHDVVRPEHATVSGIAKVVPLEAPWLSVRHLDLDPAGKGDAVAELWRPPSDTLPQDVPDSPPPPSPEVIRGGLRWLQRYDTSPVPASADPVKGLREHGVYVITGGLGGIGITLAEELAGRVTARLVLTSLSGLPPRPEWDTYLSVHGPADRGCRAIKAIRRMEQGGAEVVVLAADVTDPAAMARVRDEALRRFGRVDGLVHSAGVPGGGMAEIKERAVAEAVLAPKIRGTLVLQETFGDLPMDFVMLCSSVTAVAGGFGQVDYCGANNFMDAYAHASRAEPGLWQARVVSVNWEAWLEVGMAAEVTAPAAFRALQRGDRTQSIDHPLITTLHVADGETPSCSGIVSAETQWVLNEHRMAGIPVMPGTGYLEAAYAAATAVLPRPSGDHALELRDVIFVEPMPVADGAAAELQATFTPGTDGAAFELSSLSGGQTRVHVRGSAAWRDPGPATAADLQAVRARCTRSVPAGVGTERGLLSFGSRWADLVREVSVGQDEALALLKANDLVAAELGRWALHPALLDEATAFGHTRIRTEGTYLPIGSARVLVRGALPGTFWSHLRFRDADDSGELMTVDLSLLDEQGRELVAISDFVMRRVDPESMGALMAEAAESATAPPLALGEASVGLRPSEGAEVFCRLAATDLGAQILITPVPLTEVLQVVRGVTQQAVAEQLDSGAAQQAVHGTGREQVAPRTELEVTIADLWSEVLGTPQVGVTDDFLDLGGNSLVAVQLISLIRRKAGVRLPMRSLFEQPTVAGMAELVEHLRTQAPEATPDTSPAAAEPSIPRLPRRPADA